MNSRDLHAMPHHSRSRNSSKMQQLPPLVPCSSCKALKRVIRSQHHLFQAVHTAHHRVRINASRPTVVVAMVATVTTAVAARTSHSPGPCLQPAIWCRWHLRGNIQRVQLQRPGLQDMGVVPTCARHHSRCRSVRLQLHLLGSHSLVVSHHQQWSLWGVIPCGGIRLHLWEW